MKRNWPSGFLGPLIRSLEVTVTVDGWKITEKSKSRLEHVKKVIVIADSTKQTS